MEGNIFLTLYAKPAVGLLSLTTGSYTTEVNGDATGLLRHYWFLSTSFPARKIQPSLENL